MIDHTETLKLIMRTLQIPAAEYVPAIGDVFTIIDRALSAAPPTDAQGDDARDGARWRKLCAMLGDGLADYVDAAIVAEVPGE